MKLVKLREAADTEAAILAWARANNKVFTDSHSVHMTENGAVYTGDVQTENPPTDLPIYEVTGFYVMTVQGDFHNFPKLVGGQFEIHAPKGTHCRIKASELPKMSGKKGDRMPRVVLDGSTDSTIDLDDITNMCTFHTQSIGFGVVSGLSKVTEMPNVNMLRIKDSYEGVPSTLPGTLIALILDFADGSKMRGIHKALKSFNTSIFQINAVTPFPALLLVRRSYKSESWAFDNAHMDIKTYIALYDIIKAARDNHKDVLDVHEELIDAGLEAYAKM